MFVTLFMKASLTRLVSFQKIPYSTSPLLPEPEPGFPIKLFTRTYPGSSATAAAVS